MLCAVTPYRGFKSLRHRQKHPLICTGEGVFRCPGSVGGRAESRGRVLSAGPGRFRGKFRGEGHKARGRVLSAGSRRFRGKFHGEGHEARGRSLPPGFCAAAATVDDARSPRPWSPPARSPPRGQHPRTQARGRPQCSVENPTRRRCASSARVTSRSIRSGYAMPLASHSLGYIDPGVKPGMVFTSLSSQPRPNSS